LRVDVGSSYSFDEATPFGTGDQMQLRFTGLYFYALLGF
jgi:hypothetical protein